MFTKLSNWFRRRDKLSELEQYILSKDPQTIEDIEHWTRMYDLRPRFVVHHLMPVAKDF